MCVSLRWHFQNRWSIHSKRMKIHWKSPSKLNIFSSTKNYSNFAWLIQGFSTFHLAFNLICWILLNLYGINSCWTLKISLFVQFFFYFSSKMMFVYRGINPTQLLLLRYSAFSLNNHKWMHSLVVVCKKGEILLPFCWRSESSFQNKKHEKNLYF